MDATFEYLKREFKKKYLNSVILLRNKKMSHRFLTSILLLERHFSSEHLGNNFPILLVTLCVVRQCGTLFAHKVNRIF